MGGLRCALIFEGKSGATLPDHAFNRNESTKACLKILDNKERDELRGWEGESERTFHFVISAFYLDRAIDDDRVSHGSEMCVVCRLHGFLFA